MAYSFPLELFSGEVDSLDEFSKYLSIFIKRFGSESIFSSGYVEGLHSSSVFRIFRVPNEKYSI